MTTDDEPILVELVSCPTDLPRPTGALGEMVFRRDAWTPDEIRALRQHFADDMPISQIAEILGRGRAGVADRIYLLGLRRHTNRPWSEMDDAELSRRYGHEATATIASDLGRSCSATYVRASLLNLGQDAAPAWTPWEDAQLRAGYASAIPTAQIATIIGRPHSGTVSRASKLGLRHPTDSPDWTAVEIERAIALSEAGHNYTTIGKMLAAEGYTPRTKAGLQGMMAKTGQGPGWGRFWIAEEDALLKRAYERSESLTPLQHILGRSRFSIRWRAEYLGLRGSHANQSGWRTSPDWTEAEEATLRSQYGVIPTAELARHMGRTRASLTTRAHAMGLTHGFHKAWTDDDCKALRLAHINGVALRDLAEALGRNYAAVHKYAAKHGYSFARQPRAKTRLTRAEILDLPEA